MNQALLALRQAFTADLDVYRQAIAEDQARAKQRADKDAALLQQLRELVAAELAIRRAFNDAMAQFIERWDR